MPTTYYKYLVLFFLIYFLTIKYPAMCNVYSKIAILKLYILKIVYG